MSLKLIPAIIRKALCGEDIPMPTVLVICQDDTVEKKLRRQIRRALEEEDSTDEITFATTTRQELDEATTPAKLWQEVAGDNEPIRIGL